MDTGKGRFTEVSEKVANEITNAKGQPASRIFRIGEIIKIRGSKFRVERVKTRSLRLLLLPDEE